VLEILRAQDIEFDVIEYLKTPPSGADLEWLLDLLAAAPAALVRHDKQFKALGLTEADYQTRAAVIAVLLQHPQLLQRPIVVRGNRALIARPADRVNELLG